jgi:hypothetical protein
MRGSLIDKFVEDGWVIVDVPQPGIIHEFRALLEKKLQDFAGPECRLETVHETLDDDGFNRMHMALADYFWGAEFSLRAGPTFLPLLKDFIGLDIMVQYMPFLRFARPGKSQDNIGFHKDTQYGQTPYELAVHVPFVDLDEKMALHVISGSHRLHETCYLRKETVLPGFEKNSPQHMLGKPYAPRNLMLSPQATTVALAMRVGQAALFTPALFHGQEINRGSLTRVSTDLRFVNTHANVQIKTGKTRAGYVSISQSPVERAAQHYYAAQETITQEA